MTVTIGRRELLAALGGATVGWPLVARAQQDTMPLVGFLASYSLDRSGQRLAVAFLDGLKQLAMRTVETSGLNLVPQRVTTTDYLLWFLS
jgi:hypothetical protein